MTPTDGQSTDGQSTDGQSTDGQSTDGQSTDGQSTDGQSTDGQSTDGQSTDGQQTDGQSTDGQQTDGQSTDGQSTDGQQTDGQSTDGQQTDGQSTDGQSTDGQQTDGQSTDGQQTDGQSTDGQSTDGQSSLDPDRSGTFIITDIYPGDLGENPPFEVLPGMVVNGIEVVGCVVKTSEGISWGWTKANEEWFKRSWQKIREVAGDRYGVDFFRGCYHYLIFQQDGAKQADYFCDLVDAAGGWGDGDLMPWMDVEEADQGSQWTQKNLENATGPVLRKQLSDQLTACATAFVERFKERTGLRIAVYGRGLFRDLQMANCKFGSDSAVNPSYTAKISPMDNYGVPLDDISLWQVQGTPPGNKVLLPGYPSVLPGWGQQDYSVYIDGPRKTTLKSLRDRCLAHPG